MGYLSGWLNGGLNKTHEKVEKTRRIDSFDLDYRRDGTIFTELGLAPCELVDTDFDFERNVGLEDYEIIHPKTHEVLRVHCEQLQNNSRQRYFICPVCSKRVRFLYFYYGLRCRTCAKLNYHSQQRKHDYLNFVDEGLRYAREKLYYYPAHQVYPMDFPEENPPRPPGMHRATYQRRLKNFRWYQDRYERGMLEEYERILRRAKL